MTFRYWVNGSGGIELDDDVHIDGKSTFACPASLVPQPTVRMEKRIGASHGCTVVIGDAETIGDDVLIASGVSLRDSSGHPLNMILPGVRIGAGAVVAAGSVVTKDVPPKCVAAGNPARVVRENIDQLDR